MYVNIIDISDQKRVKAQLQQSQDRERQAAEHYRVQLEQKLKTSLTASAIVHEIQHPLATILLNCSLANKALLKLPVGEPTEALRGQLAQLAVDGLQVSATVDRMRMLLRNVETRPEHFDLAAHLYTALVYMSRDLKAAQVVYQSHGLDQACPLLGDGAQLQTAVLNLMRNAIEAMEANPLDQRRLRLDLIQEAQRVLIRVADSGPGFSEGFSGVAFADVLHSTKPHGMGIGLFLAETATTNHRGRLHVGRSAELGGAEVTLELPLPQHDSGAIEVG